MCNVNEEQSTGPDEAAALAKLTANRATAGRKISLEKTLKKFRNSLEISGNEARLQSPAKITSSPRGTSITGGEGSNDGISVIHSSPSIVKTPGSIAAVRREQLALQQAQRKMRIAHYGRSKSSKLFEDSDFIHPSSPDDYAIRRCSFITPNSDSIYVRYHDEEWGVPVHDDRILFELLTLSSQQVGSDWASILKKRQSYRTAFFDFDPETVAAINEKQKQIISVKLGIDSNRVQGIVENANRILEVREAFTSFDTYIWGFVNNKAISTRYRLGIKIPVKTSKSECISKDMVRRGFRFVGPTAVHSFMQAAGLTNDHLVTCHRHR